METYENKQIFNFSGGVNLFTSHLLMADDECLLIQNGKLEKVGSIKKINGYLKRGETVLAGDKILGGIGAIKSDGTQKQIVICNNFSINESDAYTYNSINGQWTPHGLSLSGGAKAEFEPFLDGFFMVNFQDATRWNNFTQWYTNTNVTDAPKAKYIRQYQSRIYLFYVVDGGTTYTSRCIYSDLPAGGPPMTITWTNADNFFDVDSDDGDVGMGLEVNANRLLLFKENALYRYDTNTLYKVPGCPGTISNRTIKNVEGWTLYLHSTGIWGYDGTSSSLLSRKIQDIINGISTKNFTDSCAWVKEDHYYLYVGDVMNSKAGIDIPKCLIDYDAGKKSFVWDSLTKDPTVFFGYRDDRSAVTYDDATITYDNANTTYNGLETAEQRIYFGDRIGSVYEFDKGTSFNGTAIPFLVETRPIYGDLPSNWKLYAKLVVYTAMSGKGITVQFKVDDHDWKTLGRITSRQTTFNFPSGTRGQRIQFRIMEMSSTQSFSFEGLDLFYNTGGLIE